MKCLALNYVSMISQICFFPCLCLWLTHVEESSQQSLVLWSFSKVTLSLKTKQMLSKMPAKSNVITPDLLIPSPTENATHMSFKDPSPTSRGDF